MPGGALRREGPSEVHRRRGLRPGPDVSGVPGPHKCGRYQAALLRGLERVGGEDQERKRVAQR
jgi:hypothetical protein